MRERPAFMHGACHCRISDWLSRSRTMGDSSSSFFSFFTVFFRSRSTRRSCYSDALATDMMKRSTMCGQLMLSVYDSAQTPCHRAGTRS